MRVARQPLTLDDMMATMVGVLAFGMVLTLLVGVMTKRKAY